MGGDSPVTTSDGGGELKYGWNLFSLRAVVGGQAVGPPTPRAHFAGQDGRQQGGGKL